MIGIAKELAIKICPSTRIIRFQMFMNRSEAWLRDHGFRLLILFAGVLVPLYLFGTLAEEISEQELFSFDKPVLLFLRSHGNNALDVAMIFFSRAGSAAVLVPFDVAVFLFLLRRRGRSAAIFWLLAVGGASLLNLIGKHAFARVRPELWVSLLPETTFSFPSGHAMQSMAVVVGLVALTWHGRYRWPVLLLGGCFVFLVGLSRIYLGVHFPSDILAGWTAALAWTLGLSLWYKDVWQNRRYEESTADAAISRNT